MDGGLGRRSLGRRASRRLGRGLEGRDPGLSTGRDSFGVRAEEGDRGLQLLGLGRQFLGGGRHFLGRAGVLLDHLVQLLDGLVDLAGADVLLAAGGADLRHQFGGLADVRHQALQHLAGFLGRLDGVARDGADFGGGRLAAFGQLAHFRGDDGEALAVLPGPGGLDRRVQGQQVGLARDLLHDADLGDDGAHGLDRAMNGLTAGFRVLGRLTRDLLGLGRVVGVLLDVGGHLFHRGRGLFGGGGLFGRPLAHLFRGGRQLLAARGDVVRGRQGVADHAAQALHHGLQRETQRVLVRQRLGLDRQVAVGDLIRHGGGGLQIVRQSVEGVDQVLDLVVRLDLDPLVQVADGDGVGHGHQAVQAGADAQGDPQGG